MTIFQGPVFKYKKLCWFYGNIHVYIVHRKLHNLYQKDKYNYLANVIDGDKFIS